MNDDGLVQSAILLLTLGEEQAAEVIKHLSPKEAQKLVVAMTELGSVRKYQIDHVLKRFEEEIEDQAPMGGADTDFVSRVLNRALGEDKASLLLSRVIKEEKAPGIETLKWMDPETVSELIHNEHPQIIATILVQLERDFAADVLKNFTERTRNDALMRIATLDSVQPMAMRELDDVLSKIVVGQEGKKQSLGGIRTAAEILNFVGTSIETAVLESMKEADADLAQKILDEMFRFENLIDVDDRGIQLILREVQSESLVVALKGADEALREKVFKNMSSRAAEMLRDDLAGKGPVRLSEVEAEQKEILKVARRLAEEGQIVLGGGGDDSFV
jgi:flagellar motor switch protein FliG